MADAIEAESADGTIHEFPAGTPIAVVNATMKKYAATNAPKPTSQTLGFEEGAMHVFDRAAGGVRAMIDTALPGAVPAIEQTTSAIGMPTYDQAVKAHQQYFAGKEKQETPGGIGRFAGEMVATLPAARLGPAAGGAVIGPLVGNSNDPFGITLESALGAAGGKAVDAGASALGRAVAPYLRKPTAIAADYVRNLATRAGKSVQEITDYGEKMFGKPVTGAEAIGRTGKTALTAVGRREGETADKLEGYLAQRKLEAPERMLDDFAESVGVSPEAAQGNVDAIVKAGRQAAAPKYDIALAKEPYIDDRLKQFANEDIVKNGMAAGIKIQRLEALAEGKPFDPNAYAITGFNEAGDPIIGPVPTWRTWDAAKTGLDAMLEQFRDPRTGKLVLTKLGHAIDAVRSSMLKEIDKVNPEYAQARATAGDYLSARSAYDYGQNMLTNARVTEKQFAERLAKMSDAERESLKGGIANTLFNMAQTGRLKPSLLMTPRVQQKLIAAFGRDGAAQFVNRLAAEQEMAASGARMMPGAGSVTSEVLNATAEQDKAMAALADVAHGALHAYSGNWAAAGRKIGGALSSLYRTAGMPVEVRNEVGRLLMMSPEELGSYLHKNPAEIPKLFQVISQYHPSRAAAAAASVGAGQIDQ